MSLNNCFRSWLRSQAAYTKLQLIVIKCLCSDIQAMKQADAVKCAQVKWKELVAESEDQYVAAPKNAAEHLKRNRMKWIDSFFRVQLIL